MTIFYVGLIINLLICVQNFIEISRHLAMTKMHRLGFLERGEYRCFSVIRVSQGSVATYVRCGGMSTQHL